MQIEVDMIWSDCHSNTRKESVHRTNGSAVSPVNTLKCSQHNEHIEMKRIPGYFNDSMLVRRYSAFLSVIW